MNVKYRFGWGMFFLWLFIAIAADLLTLIPFVGLAVGPVYWTVFSIYLYMTKHGFVNWKSLATKGFSVASEMVVVFQALPTITVCTIIIFVLSRTEDRTGINIKGMAEGKGVRSPAKQQPLNQNGVRLPRNVEEADFSTEDRMAA